MYSLVTYRDPPLIQAELVGRFDGEELHSLARDLDQRLLQPGASSPALLLDVSRFEATGDAALAVLNRYVERTLGAGIRVGQVVQSQLVAHQLDRVAAEGGLGALLRHFGERAPALVWLREGAG